MQNGIWEITLVQKKDMSQRILTVMMKEIDVSLSRLRLSNPVHIKKTKVSMEENGQLHPVLLRKTESGYQLLDGFKRYYAADQLGWKTIEAIISEVTEPTGLALMISYNKGTHGLVDYEQAMIIKNLKVNYLLTGQEISQMIGYSTAWVSRRLSLIEKLDESVQDALRMGTITSKHARNLIKLPRGNQNQFLAIITGYNLTSSQTILLVEKYLKSSKKEEAQWVLSHPKEVLEMSMNNNKEIYDNRLGVYGNRLLKAIILLRLQQQIFIGNYTDSEREKLNEIELSIVGEKLPEVMKRSQTIVKIISKNEIIP